MRFILLGREFMRSMHKQDTIVAVATAFGEAAIAVVRLSGPETFSIIGKVFKGKRRENIADLPGYTVRYGHFLDLEGNPIDQGLLTVFRAPRSYTGEDMAELSCHGGRAIVSRLMQAILSCGARVAEPGEFTQRAFFNGKLDLAQAEAVADLVRAKTERARRVALNQLEGSLSRTVHSLQAELLGILAEVEVTIDYNDEAEPLNYNTILHNIVKVYDELRSLMRTQQYGRILREGLRVALLGPPNVGKSSLLNCLLQVERAIVTPIPGTTRDIIEETLSLDGIPVVLVDTAGLRHTADPVEQIGVERALKMAENADIILALFDASEKPHIDITTLPSLLTDSQHTILLVLNKRDLASTEMLGSWFAALRESFPNVADIIAISALTGENVEALRQAILCYAEPSHGDMEGAIITSARHAQALHKAIEYLSNAIQTTQQGLPEDFIALDLRSALEALAEITGEAVDDALIERIFQDFCVGK